MEPNRAGTTKTVTATGSNVKGTGQTRKNLTPRWVLRIGVLSIITALVLVLATPVILWKLRHEIFRSDWAREQILNQVETRTGIRPRWNGELELLWQPSESSRRDKLSRLQITLGPGAIANPPGFSETPLFSWQRLRVAITLDALQNLIRHGRLHVESVQLTGVALQAERNAIGAGNWEHLLAGTPSREMAETHIDELTIESFNWQYRDTAGVRLASQDDTLRLDHWVMPSPEQGQIETLYWETFDQGGLTLQKLQWDQTDEGVLTLDAEWQFKGLALRKLPLPDWLLAAESNLEARYGEGHFRYAQSETLADHQQVALHIRDLQIDEIALRGRLTYGDQWDMDLQLGQVRLDPYLTGVDSPPNSLSAAPMTLSLMERPVYGTITLHELSYRTERLRDVVLRLRP